MLKVADLTDGGITILEDQSDFTGREFDVGIFPLLCHQLTIGSGAPDDLATLAYLQFDIMNQRPCWNIAQGESIAGLNISRRAGDHAVSNPDLGRGKDISFLSVCIVKQSD